MNLNISKRVLVRIISFAVALIIVLGSFIYINYNQAKKAQLSLEYHYLKSIDDLTSYIQNINTTLTKTMYAQTPQMLSFLATKVWREAGFAKDCLSNLPVDYLNLNNTNKLLSQVGDYTVSISKKFERGETITDEERSNIAKLNEYCQLMFEDMLVLSDAIKSGTISLISVASNINHDFDKSPMPQEISEGFKEDSEGFTAYPKLIYDGPYSDHLLERDPLMLKDAAEISESQAREKAALLSGVAPGQLKTGNDEDGKMASYCFESDGVDVSITKKGGFGSYMLKSRNVGEAKLSTEDALKKARDYMSSIGIGALKSTYYEISNNVITINYAHTQDNVVLYTDLIKIGVALDNGEIVSFDARGYITNNHSRNNLKAKISQDDAKKSVSKNLTIENVQLCVIPSDALEEKLCYEFKCKAEDGNNIMVYVNAANGLEEQILILIISENGTLTM